ncbi:MAG TPA: tRNA lysidine(34) synthetase TilS [Chitinophagaceae bacterium]|nr:tRNA lysidine(34) synthetase TilS [Chitinophagaceae bacterium]
MNLLQSFTAHIKQQFPFLQPQQTKLLLAVSGGIDSVVMTDLFYNVGFDFIIAHCNFQLRSEESERDEQFVKTLQKQYSKEVHVKKFNTDEYAEKNKYSIQEAARALRYEWFEELIAGFKNEQQNNLQFYLATAHHADDNIETLLMYFFRGTGIHGLTGMPAYNAEKKILRPMLFATREGIVGYAKEKQLQWVEDSSNAKNDYTRNFFRNQLLPMVKEVFPNAQQNLHENIQRFKDAEQLYLQALEAHKKKLLQQKGNEIHIPILLLKKTAPMQTILWEIIKPFSFSPQQVAEAIKLFDAENGSYIQSATHRIIKNRAWLIIAANITDDAQHIIIESNAKKIDFSNGSLQLHELQNTNLSISSDSCIAMLDEDEINFPLILRKWKQGDYFYPLGMRKKKKLSRFFIDQKLSRTEKEKAWVIEMNKKIIWLIGYRIDDRFKVTPRTKSVMKIIFNAVDK